jgi:hypothetical protein
VAAPAWLAQLAERVELQEAEPRAEHLWPERTSAWLHLPGYVARAAVAAPLVGVVLRIALDMLNASDRSTFVAWAREVTAPLVDPFVGALPSIGWGGVNVPGDDLLALGCFLGPAWAVRRWMA